MMGHVNEHQQARPGPETLDLNLQAAPLLGMDGPHAADQVARLAPGLQRDCLATAVELEIVRADGQRVLAGLHQYRFAAGFEKTLDGEVRFARSSAGLRHVTGVVMRERGSSRGMAGVLW